MLTGKIGGAGLMSRFVLGMDTREALAVGVLMNTRGLVELIILNIGLDAGVLNRVSKLRATLTCFDRPRTLSPAA